MKNNIFIIMAILALVLISVVLISGCTPAFDPGSLENRISTLEAAPTITPQPTATPYSFGGVSMETVQEMINTSILSISGGQMPIQDDEPRFYAGDEDVTDLIDQIWIAKTADQVCFGVDASTDALSSEHAGILYVVPGDEIQQAINWTGYDLYSPGTALIHSGDKSPQQRITDAVTKWVTMPAGHPREWVYEKNEDGENVPIQRIRGVIFYAAAYEYWNEGAYDILPGLKLVQLTNSRMDIPWHAHYGYVIWGCAPVSWSK